MPKVIIENIRGQWVVDKSTEGVFVEKGIGYADGALIEIEVVGNRSLCCHPDSPVVCTHQ